MQENLLHILNYTVLNTPVYKFGIAFVTFFVFLLARKLFSKFVIGSLKIAVSKTKTHLDDIVLNSLEKPLGFVVIIIGFYVSAVVINLQTQIIPLVKTLFIFVIFWSFYNLVKSFENEMLNIFSKKFSKEIALFFIKSLKVFIVALGIVAILQNLGINVSAFIASLGLGGLAFALAAKDTAANLFGGFAILTDKMFKIGDWVKIGNVEGIVEDIGMRTTKIRAFDKRLITVPNATIANTAVDNFSRRNKRRIKMRVGLTYSTSIETMQKILNEIREMLKNHPQIHKEPMFVYFDEFGDSSLNLFFYLFTTTANWEEYLKIREDINLKIIDIVEKNGSSFAFPSQSIYFENELSVLPQK